uniref:Uncharacterized protein LOC105060485 isoform X2 n=1 Tax=Elaeis guineensis var. tenera TaxID=51953 RepID=A0A8N4ESL1_ELAGV|nr:uncharacterized protein LOC105060485 isoform X2 [Elaeis guineensis]
MPLGCSQWKMLLTLLNSRGETISITYKPDGIHIAVGNKEDELLILDVRKFKPIHWRKITYQVLLRYWVIHLLSCFTLWWLVRQVALISQLISYEGDQDILLLIIFNLHPILISTVCDSGFTL